MAIVVLGALLFSSAAQACTCLEMSPRAALRQADGAVSARLIQIDPVDRYGADYLYRVRRVYKPGPGLRAGETVSVHSGINGASCGLPDDNARWYGLFLSRREGQWSGGLCGIAPPREIAAAARALRRGDELASPVADSTPDCAS
ncbi:MAG: hypothetical protein ABW196_07705 [Solirubrobacterales bacterium]